MKWGVLLTTARPPRMSDREVLSATIERARLAETSGYDSVWVLEHHFTPFGICPDTLSLASYILGQTTRLHVGTAVLIAPFMHPVRIAESTAMLDQLSEGRFHLGLGRGGFPRDFEVFGVDASRTHEMMREWFDILEHAWSDDVLSYDGPLYKVPSVPVYPKPFTSPRPPFYLAAESPSTVEWAAKRALPLVLVTTLEDEEMCSRMELYRETAEAAGHDPSAIQHVLTCVSHVADSNAEAKARMLADLEWWRREESTVYMQFEDLRKLPNYSFHLRRLEQAVLEGRAKDDFKIPQWLDMNPVGTAERCIERLEELVEMTGAHHVVLGFEGAGDAKVVNESIERFASDVLPKVTQSRATVDS